MLIGVKGRTSIISTLTHGTHCGLIHHVNLRRYSCSWTNTVQSDEADLILNVKLVIVVLVEEHL